MARLAWRRHGLWSAAPDLPGTFLRSIVEVAHPPARLAELTTNYLSHVPEDLFSGQPLLYRAQGTNWLLYSVGPDGVDDGGKPVDRTLASGSKGDLFFDSP